MRRVVNCPSVAAAANMAATLSGVGRVAAHEDPTFAHRPFVEVRDDDLLPALLEQIRDRSSDGVRAARDDGDVTPGLSSPFAHS